jgi:hypothetical protein
MVLLNYLEPHTELQKVEFIDYSKEFLLITRVLSG